MRIEGYILKFDHIWSKYAVYYMPGRPILEINEAPLRVPVNVETREDGLYGVCDIKFGFGELGIAPILRSKPQWSAVVTICDATPEGVVTMCMINEVRLVESGRGCGYTISD